MSSSREGYTAFMNRFSRSLSGFLAFSLVLAAPGLAPYQAAAQTIGARVALPGQAGSVGAAVRGASPAGFALPSSSLQSSLIPSLSPSAALAPALSAPAAMINAAVPIRAVAAPAANVSVIAAAPAKAAAAPSAPAVSALVSGSAALTAASNSASADAPRVALDGLFEGSLARDGALAVSARSAASDSPRLEPSSPRAGPRWVKTLQAPGDAPPATSLKRTLSVGLLGAVIPLAITMAAVTVAQLLGYQLHPNYEGPMGSAGMSVLQAVAVWIGAAVMAPVSEEAIFRGALQGRLAKLSAKLRLGSFVAPAIITSLIFVALHETSDPLLFATRFVHAMILSYVYQKEGILASMAAHGFFNGLLAVSIVATAMGMPWLSLAAAPAALFFAYKSWKTLKAQKPDISSGALIPKTMSGPLALAFAAILMLGYFFIMPNIFWPIGAVALLINGIMKLKKTP